MKRVIAAFRLVTPKHHQTGPLHISAGRDVPAEGIGDFLDAVYIAVEKIRDFGLPDAVFGGPMRVEARTPEERANGRYIPKDDQSLIYFPQVRGVPDWVWTIIHELAHRVWHKHLSKEAKEIWAAFAENMGKPIPPSAADAITRTVAKHPDKNNLWFFFTKHFGHDLDMFKAWLQTKRVSDQFPTDYANADPAESFAEVMADTILGRGHAGVTMKRSGPTMKKLFLSLVAPLRAPQAFQEWLTEQQDENFLQSQIDVPDIAGELARWTNDNLADSMVAKYERRPHVTLVYGLDKRDGAQIGQVARDYGRPIRLSLGVFNFFDAPDYDVLYIEIVSEGIYQLRKELMSLPNTRRQIHDTYIPHLTVAYLKKGQAAKYRGTTPFHRIVSRDGFSLIDAAGVESFVPTVDSTVTSPVLLANS